MMCVLCLVSPALVGALNCLFGRLFCGCPPMQEVSVNVPAYCILSQVISIMPPEVSSMAGGAVAAIMVHSDQAVEKAWQCALLR